MIDNFGGASWLTYEKLMRRRAHPVSIMPGRRPAMAASCGNEAGISSSPEETSPSVTITRGSLELPSFSMFRTMTLLAGSTLIVMASFMFTLSVIDKGFVATCLSLIEFLNP
jgi:hypothetical protein